MAVTAFHWPKTRAGAGCIDTSKKQTGISVCLITHHRPPLHLRYDVMSIHFLLEFELDH